MLGLLFLGMTVISVLAIAKYGAGAGPSPTSPTSPASKSPPLPPLPPLPDASPKPSTTMATPTADDFKSWVPAGDAPTPPALPTLPTLPTMSAPALAPTSFADMVSRAESAASPMFSSGIFSSLSSPSTPTPSGMPGGMSSGVPSIDVLPEPYRTHAVNVLAWQPKNHEGWVNGGASLYDELRKAGFAAAASDVARTFLPGS